MSKNLPLLIGVLLAIWLIGCSWWYSTNHCPAANSDYPSLSINNGDFSGSASDIFSFGMSSHIPSISSETGQVLKSLANYLGQNPERILTLSGLFTSSDKNNSRFGSLGTARAESIKQELIKFGADESNIETNGLRVDNSVYIDEKLYGGVYFTFSEKEKEEELVPMEEIEEVPEVADNSFFDSKTIYYNSGAYKLDLGNKEIADYLVGLKDYLRANPDRTVVISGHTDNVGDQKSNELISRARASKVRRFLVDNRVSRKQIQISSASFNEPVASNDSENGKNQNRRVEIKIE